MKRGTTPTLHIELEGINLAEIAKITFIFKQEENEWCRESVIKSANILEVNGEYDFDPDGEIYLDEIKTKGVLPIAIEFSEEDTRTFEGGNYFYMDTRIEKRTVDGATKVVSTDIAKIMMTKTLFSEFDVEA